MSLLEKKAIKATEQLSGKDQYLMQQQEKAILKSLRDIDKLPENDQRRKFVERSRNAYFEKYGIWLVN